MQKFCRKFLFLWVLAIIHANALAAVEEGQLALHSDWTGSETIPLQGTFYIFPGELLDPAKFAPTLLSSSRLGQVPDASFLPENLQILETERSYVVRLPDHSPNFKVGLSQGWTTWASRVYLWRQDADPLLIISSGQIGENGESDRIPAWDRNSAAPLPAWEAEAYLIIHVATSTFGDSIGLWPPRIIEPFQIGAFEHMSFNRRMHTYQIYLVLGLYLFMSINSFAIFIQRREDKSSFILGWLGLALALRYIATEGIPAQLVFEPSMTAFKLNAFGIVFAQNLIVFLIIIFQFFTFSSQVGRGLLRSVSLVTGLSIVLYFVLSPTLYLRTWVLFTPIVALLGCTIVWIYFRSWRRGEESAIYGLIGITLVMLTHFWDAAVQTLRLGHIYLGQYGWASLLFCQSLIIGQRFARTYERTKIMGRDLQQKNIELVSQKKQIENLNSELKEYNERLESMVEEKTRDIRSILTHIQQGILAINGPNGELADEHSHYLKHFFEFDEISGLNIMDLCFRNSDLGQDSLDLLKNAIMASIGEEEIAFSVNQSAFPSQCTYSQGAKTKLLEIDWNPVLNNGMIVKILVVMRDVTELRNLQAETQKGQAEFTLLAEIINIPAEKFKTVMDSSSHLLSENRSLLQINLNLSPVTVDKLFRNMHTLKGLARSYNLTSLTDMVHAAEEKYKEIKDGASITAEELMSDINELEARIDRIQTLNDTKLGRKLIDGDRYIVLDKEQLAQNFRHLQAIDFSILKGDDRARLQCVKDLFRKIIYTPLSSVIAAQVQTLGDLAASLGKQAPVCIFGQETVSINRELHELLNRIFSHLLRNSLDHGLETAEERVIKGKPENGHIHFEVSTVFERLKIVYWDDGKGLDLTRILEKARNLGLANLNDQTLNRSTVAHLILTPGFSTADRVTDISGRGIGMDAVRAYLEQNNGIFELILDDPEGFDLGRTALRFSLTLFGGHFQIME